MRVLALSRNTCLGLCRVIVFWDVVVLWAFLFERCGLGLGVLFAFECFLTNSCSVRDAIEPLVF